MISDKFKDKCGVFGIYGHPDAIALALRGLSALQHRGQESAGIAFNSAGRVETIKVMGAVKDLFHRLDGIRATAAIGHVRYGTSGCSSVEYAQPFVSAGSNGSVALCHNGHIIGIDQLRKTVGARDASGMSNDTELLTLAVAMHFTGELTSAIRAAFEGVTPSYSVAVLTADSMCAVRDPLGMRPLSFGRKGTATVVSSETCGLNAIDAIYVRDVDPGEILHAQGENLTFHTCVKPRGPAHCIFELIYFARPDSILFGHSVAEFRIRLGRRLAVEAPAPGDVVVPIPESAVYGAQGFAQASGIQLGMAFFRQDFVGRSFIQPTPVARIETLRAKLNPIKSLIAGQRIVLVDDSIVRGNTCLHIVRMLREAGAREVHVRITSPPTIASCHFGVDTPDDRDLFANGRSISEMTEAIGADSLSFLSLDGLMAVAAPKKGFCAGCFSGIYPVSTEESGEMERYQAQA